MNHSLSHGWAILTVAGIIPQELRRLVRAIEKAGGRKLAPRTFAISAVRGQAGLDALVATLKQLNTRETSFQAIYVTRLQWERSHLVHGSPA